MRNNKPFSRHGLMKFLLVMMLCYVFLIVPIIKYVEVKRQDLGFSACILSNVKF